MPWDKITDEQINSFTYTNVTDDNGEIAPVAPSAVDLPVPELKQRMDQIRQKLDAWPAGHVEDDGQRVRNLLSVAAIADFTQDPLEGSVARAVFDRLEADFDRDELEHILAWILISPDGGTVVTSAPELDLDGPVNDYVVRQRCVLYAQKLLGRLLGKLPEVQKQVP
jgi:hypothetical protein